MVTVENLLAPPDPQGIGVAGLSRGQSRRRVECAAKPRVAVNGQQFVAGLNFRTVGSGKLEAPVLNVPGKAQNPLTREARQDVKRPYQQRDGIESRAAPEPFRK